MKKNKSMGKRKKIINREAIRSLIIVLTLILAFAFIYFFSSGLTGLFLGLEDMITYSQKLDLSIDSSQKYTWNLKNYPELFNLKSAGLTGSYIGNETAKVYLEDDEGRRYLILDTSNIKEEHITSITAYAVNVPEEDQEETVKVEKETKEKSTEEETKKKTEEKKEKSDKTEEQPAEQQPAEQQPAEQQPAEQQPAEQQPAEQQPAEQQPAEQQPAEQQPAEQQPAEQQPAEQQPAEQQPAEQPETNITEEHGGVNITGETIENITEEIPEEAKIIENVTEEINITTNITEETNISLNITEETNITTNITANITQNTTANISEETNISLNITEETNITTNITANITQNITANISEETNISLNITEEINTTTNITEETNITSNITANITANITQNTTANISEETNISLNITEEINITLEQYRNVEFEISGFRHEWKQTWGTITETRITVTNNENQSINIKYALFDFEGYETTEIVKLSEFKTVEAGETKEISIPMHFNYQGEDQRNVRLRIKNENEIILASAWGLFNPLEAQKVEKITFDNVCGEACILPDGLVNTSYKLIFEIDSGILEINNITYVLKNLTEQPLPVQFNVLDHGNKEINSVIRVYNKTDLINKSYNDEILALKQGQYDIQAVPENHTIDSMLFNSANIDNSFNKFLKLDQGLKAEYVVQSYVIKPLIKYESAILNITSKGDRLYRCDDWSYTFRYCKSEFKFIKELVENKTYSVNISYETIAFLETLGINATNISYKKVADDPRYDAIIDSTDYNNETGELIVVFHHDSLKPIPIKIKGRINYTLDKNISATGENVTLIVHDWQNKRFRILVGAHTEGFEFGVPIQLTTTTEVKDANDHTVNATIEFIDSLTGVIKIEKTRLELQKAIEEGEYNIKIKLKKHPIKEIEFENIEVYQDFTQNIKIDDVNKTGNLTRFTEVYAIDPTNFNFTNATVTVTATGTELYKCKDWNFTTQTCFGTWILFKSDLVPGENYTFTLTPDDPGFGEINITAAIHLDENYTFISNIYNESRYLDNNWSERIYENEFVRVTFEENISNDNIIYVYARGDASQSTYFEVYRKNTTFPPIGRSVGYNGSTDYISNEDWYQVDVENLTEPEDEFDFKIINTAAGTGWVEFDYIEDPITAYQAQDRDGDCGRETRFTTYQTVPLISSWSPCTKGEKVQVTTANAVDMVLAWLNNGGYSSHMNVTGQPSGSEITLKSKNSPATGYIKLVEVNPLDAAIIQVLDTYSFVMPANNDIIKTDISMLSGIVSQGNTFGILISITPDESSDLKVRWGSYNTYKKRLLVNVNETAVTDTTPPASITNLQNISTGRTWLYWNWTNPADSDFNESIIYIDSSNVQNTTNNYYNATGFSCETTHNITVHTKDTTGNINNTDITNITATASCPDTQAPTYSNINEPTDPSTYSTSATYNFNITWTDNVAVDTVILEFNGINYTDISNISSVYYRNFGALAAGNYNYEWYANDTVNNQNNTGTLTFTINKANPSCSLVFDKNSPQTYGAQINASCSCTNPEANAALYRDGTDVTSTENNQLVTLSATTHNYVCNVSSTQNYTTATNTSSFTINKADPGLSLTASPSWSETYGTQTTVNCSANNSQVSLTLTRDSQTVSIPDVQILAANTYNYNCNTSGNENYTAASETNNLTINKANTTTNLYLNGQENNKTITYGTQSNATAATNTGTVILYRNGTEVSNPEIATLTAGIYNYTAINPGDENYTGSSVTWFLTVNKASSEVNLLLNGTDNNITIEVGSTVNETGSLTTGENTIELYEQGSLVNNGASPLTNITQYNTLGTFNVTVKYSESENYSASQETHWITVQDTTPPTVNLESPANNTETAAQTQSFTFNFTDNYYSTASCTLYIDNIASGTNSTVSAGISTTIANNSISEGSNNWYVNCTDASGNTGQSQTRTLIIDLTPPNITLIRPIQNQIIGYTVNLDADIIDDLTTVNSAWYEITNSSGVQASGTLTAPDYQDNWDSTAVADGNYTFIVYANDSVNNQNNTQANFTVDNTQPFIQILAPTNNTRLTENINLNITYQNTWLNTTKYNITNSSSALIQSNTTNSVSATYYEFNDAVNINSLADDTYTIIAYALDKVGYQRTEQSIFIVDNSAPTYTNINEPTDPGTYSPSAAYTFNVTFTDDSIDEVWLIFNGTTYTDLTQDGNIYSRTFTNLAAETYEYTWYANDTVNNQNNTGTLTFTVNQAATTLTLTASPSWAETYGTQTAINCSADNDEITPILYRDGTQVSIPDIQTLAATTYAYICNATSSENYSAPAQQQNILTINKATAYVNISLNEAENNVTITYPQTLTAVYSTNVLTAIMYRNGTDISNENNTPITLAVGYYNYTVVNLGNGNYTGSSKTFFATIHKNTSTCSLIFNLASPQTYGTAINASCSCTNPEASAVLWRNGTDISSTENNQLITLAAGDYNYVCNASETQNYTSASNTSDYTVNKAASGFNLLLNSNDYNLSVIHDRTVNITAQTLAGEGIIQLYEDGNLINSGTSTLTNITSYHGLGLKNITVIYSETENYTASSKTHFINVTNELPTFNSLSITPSIGKLDVLINITTYNATDQDNDNYTLRCGDSSGLSNLCNSTEGTGDISCMFNSSWSDDTNHTIYCRIDDTVNTSSEKTIIFTADNTAPSSGLTAVDGDTSSPYWDTSNNSQTILSATTETGAQCRYGTTDAVYSLMSNDCSVSDGNVNCNLGNIAQTSSTTYHISCKDQYDNEQSTSQNLDIAFGVDYTAPTTYDDYDGNIKIPGHQVTIHESDIPIGTIITTWYCAPNAGCTPETLIDDGENVTFNNRGTNYLRYYSQDEANNTQDIKTTQIFINNLISTGSVNYTNYNGHSFTASITPTDADSSQNITCMLYHRPNETGNYSSKAMTGATTRTATISTNDGYSALDVIQLYIECNDSLEIVNTSTETHSMPNNLPTTPNLISPDNNTTTTETTMLLSYSSADLDNDTIVYYVYGDTSANPTTLIYNGTATNYNWSLTRNQNGIQNNYWKVLASDSYQNSSFSGIRNIIVNDTKGISVTDPADQDTDRNVNATYTITISNQGAADSYSLSVNNINNAGTAQLNQSSLNISANQNKSIKLYVTDDDAIGEYVVNLTVISDSDASITEEISITTTVYGTLSAFVALPGGSPPPIYYEAQIIELQSYVYDELNNPIDNAEITFEPITGLYYYACTNITDLNNGYYNCSLDTAGMQESQYYDIRINASKNFYHSVSITNTSVFLLSGNQEANLTLDKLPSVHILNDTAIVYNISNILTNLRGFSQSTNLTDPNANQTWELGDMGTETITRSYLLTYARGNNAYTITLNKSNASSYDPIYENSLFIESNQPVIVIPENESQTQLTLIKNLVYKNQTTTNVTYGIVIEVVNSGDVDLENIEVTDTDIGLDTKVNLTEGQSWQTSANLLMQKTPQTYTESFVKTRASASGDIFYSNQLNITIPGYGGPYDVIITSLPGSVETDRSFTVNIKVINQNTEVAEDRWLTTVIKDNEGTIYDIDIRTVYIGRNQSATTSITLTAPSSTGIYYVYSELVWPTATADASRSFTVISGEGPASAAGGGASETETSEEEIITTPACGDGSCDLDEAIGDEYECLKDCGYDCDGDYIGDSWTKCIVTIKQIPDDVKQDIITLKNKVNGLESKTEQLKQSGAATREIEDLINELRENIKEIEESIAKGKFDWARNLIKNAYIKAGTPVIIEKLTARATKQITKPLDIPWKSIYSFVLILIVIAIFIVGAAYKHRRDEDTALKIIRARRHKLERINDMIDKTIDKIYFKKGGR